MPVVETAENARTDQVYRRQPLRNGRIRTGWLRPT
jgi:hypothetical protein